MCEMINILDRIKGKLDFAEKRLINLKMEGYKLSKERN